MIFRRLDINDDWTFGNGKGNFAMDQEAINLNIKTRLLSWKNDCFFSMNDFIDWNGLLSQRNSDNIELAVKSVILQSYGVIGVNSVTVSYDSTTRTITITYDIDTIYGTAFTSVVYI